MPSRMSFSLGTRPVLIVALAILAILPVVLERHAIDLMVFAALYCVAGLGVGLLLGQCGIVNLAQSFFYGIGAYASAYGTTAIGWPPVIGILAGMAIAGLTAFAIGWPILRLTGFFLALATLAVGMIGTILFFEWDWLTGGTLGIGGLPPLGIAGFVFDSPARFYYLAWGLVLVLLLAAGNLSPEGRVLPCAPFGMRHPPPKGSASISTASGCGSSSSAPCSARSPARSSPTTSPM